MYQVAIGILYIGIVVLVAEVFYVYHQKSSKTQLILVSILIATIVNLIGYVCEMQATDMRTAVMALKIAYCGKPYIVFGTFIIVLEFCGIWLPKKLIWALAAVHLSVTALVLTSDWQSLYYERIGYMRDGLFPHLVIIHGPFYELYTGLIVFYLVIMIGCCVVQYQKTQNITEKKRINCMGAIAGVSVLGFVIYLTGITKGYDTTAPAYVISASILFYAMLKYNLMDGLVVAKDMIIEEFYDGILVADNEGKIIYNNEQAMKIYPELKFIKNRKIVSTLEELLKLKRKLYVEDRIYNIQEKDIYQNSISYGKIYLLNDVTESYFYMTSLEKQKNIAEQANRAKSDFLAQMSHEIRTPINAVLGMNEMILRESTEDDVKKYAMDVKTSAYTLLDLINDILDTSKIEAGKMELVCADYQLSSLLHDIMNMIDVRAKKKGLEFVVNVENTLPNDLYGDSSKIRQILVNILTNAVKYTKEGTVTFTVSGAKKGNLIQLHFEVKDTGIGMKKEEIAKLFSPFERLDLKKNQSIEGTGLGMSITKQLLDMLHSKLDIRSVYGKGSTFSFDLLQETRSEEEIGNLTERMSKLTEFQDYHSHFIAPDAKVLVVDDNEVNRNVFCSLLKKTKIQITDADSGQKCLNLVEKEHFDLIFLDHMMPEMDGIETLHQMKQREKNQCKDVPVIILTANAILGAKEKYLEEGFDDYLSKPINADKLERLIQIYLPKELCLETTEEESKKEFEEDAFDSMPELEGFDWIYAKEHLKDQETLRKTIQIFYRSIDTEITTLTAMLEAILEENASCKDYRIRVHALKSSAAVIGALLLSNIAKLLEMAAREEDRERIVVLHPILIEELVKHKERLKVMMQENNEHRKPMDVKVVKGLLEQLKVALDTFEYDRADLAVEELQNFEFSAIMQEKVKNLAVQVENLDMNHAITSIDEMIEIIRQENQNEENSTN